MIRLHRRPAHKASHFGLAAQHSALRVTVSVRGTLQAMQLSRRPGSILGRRLCASDLQAFASEVGGNILETVDSC